MARLQVDRRKRALMQQLDATRVSYQALTLPVGDVLCTFDKGGCTFLVERKRADDFAAALKDGRAVCIAPFLFFIALHSISDV